jgi:hypothetical protein
MICYSNQEGAPALHVAKIREIKHSSKIPLIIVSKNTFLDFGFFVL